MVALVVAPIILVAWIQLFSFFLAMHLELSLSHSLLTFSASFLFFDYLKLENLGLKLHMVALMVAPMVAPVVAPMVARLIFFVYICMLGLQMSIHS